MQSVHLLFRQSLAILLTVLLASPVLAQPANPIEVKSQVLNITPGSSVEVRLIDKTRLRGRLGAITDTGFELQALQGARIDTQQIAFERVKSIRDKGRESFGHSVGKGFIIAGIVIGTIMVVALVTCLASESHCSG